MARGQEPCEALALDEEARAEGMLRFAEEHPEKDPSFWQACAQRAFASAAAHTAQPEPLGVRDDDGR